MAITTRIEMKGPILEGKSGRVLRREATRMIRTLVELGEQRLDQVLRPRPGGVFLSVTEARPGKSSTGHYRRSVSGTVQELHGRIDDGNVVYGPWLEGVGSRNQTTRFKGYASFRRTAQWLQKQVNGVARKAMGRLVRSLGG